MRNLNRLWIGGILVLMLIATEFVAVSTFAATGANASSNQDILLQYEWSQFNGGSSFSRFSAGPAPDSSAILWKANVTGIQTYISAFDGMIFVGTNTSVVALDQATGEKLWETPIPMTATWPIAYKIDDAHMIVESSCLDPKTGKILWTSSNFTADTGIFNANVYSPEEKMFYTKVDSYIKAWSFADPANPPTLVWTTYIPGGGKTGIGTTYGDGKVFAGSFENQQLALDAKTGDVLWTTLTKGPMIFSGSYYDGRFFRGGTDDNTMYCFNATNGEILWTYTPNTDGYFTTGCAVAYGMVYEMNKDGHLYAFDIKTGNLVWKYKGPDETLLWPGMPTVADGKVYVTTGQVAQYGGQVGTSEFACLDAYTGRPIWKLPIEALAPRESVAVAYGKLYLIPGNVTTSVDAISGSEYTTMNEVWAIGSNAIPVSDWPMWRADAAHSSTAQTGPSNLTLAWKFTTNGAVISSPSVADGIVYVGSQDRNIYALGAWSGNLIWKFTTLDAVESSPAVAGGKVFTGGDDGYVYCLDAYTGARVWSTFVNGNLPYTYGSLVLKSSPAVVGDKVYVGSLDGFLYALNVNNGNIDWKFKTEGPILSSPAVSDGAVYFTSEEPTAGALYKLNAATGAMLWKQEIPYEYQFTGGTEMIGSPSVAAGMVFASSDLRTYYGINAVTGDIVWTFSDPAAMEFIVSSPIYVNGELYIIDKFSITSLNATTGKTIWSFFTGDELYVSPAYADGKIYIVTSQRHIYILDARNNGTKLAGFTTPSSSWSSPTISNGRLYVGNNDWNVYCLTNLVTYEEPTPPPEQSTSGGYVFLIVAIAIIILAVAIVVVNTIKKRRKSSTYKFSEGQ
ncbi:PQQ-binding-like beta-propeller repeat protein [Candidatus Bathyarchaeota archaeon A05DMB-2]|jgi:outer membrane protein assembly factor BamB|nr:PQQ-binding-like beta-propeller repeat protein [Candidatus Bathyarchaeota archaeon A05DMB-2]